MTSLNVSFLRQNFIKYCQEATSQGWLEYSMPIFELQISESLAVFEKLITVKPFNISFYSYFLEEIDHNRELLKTY